MKNKHAHVSGKEIPFPSNAVLVSKTDTKGIITYANDAFVEISGFSREELIGKNHNLVRHPDMPPQAFEWMWDTLKAERPWRGTVKNLAKNGDHYWVRATVAPIIEHGRIIGYVSVRKPPTRAQIAEAEALYSELNQTGRKIVSAKDKLKFSNWSLAAKFDAFLQLILLVALSCANLYLVYDLRGDAREAAQEKGRMLASSLIDSANILMVTGQIGEPANRELILHKILSNNAVESVTLARTRAVADVYGEGLATEQIARPRQREAAETGQTIALHEENAAGKPVVRVITPYKASKNFHGTDCTTCHQVPEGTVLGVSDITLSMEEDYHHVEVMMYALFAGQAILQLVLYFVAGWFMRRYIGRPVDAIHAEFRHIMEGNLDTELDISKCDEMGEILCDIQSMQAYLRTMVDEIAVPVGHMQAHLGSLSKQVASVADNAAGEQEHILSIAAAMEQFSRSVSGVAEMAADSFNDAKSMQTVVERNNADMERSIIASGEVGESADASSSAITELGESIEKIGVISNAIKEIADQTNLLALNAAIEAARAGEQGRGFAVVADEVRRLAERTADSTKSIGGIVAEINAISAGAATTMGKTKAKVDESIELIRRCGEGMHEVLNVSGNVVSRMEHIANASQEQAATGKDVASSLEQITVLIERNTDLAVQSKGSAIALAEDAQELRRAGYPLTRCAVQYK